MARERDFYRLNKRDQKDLLAVLNRTVIIPNALRTAGEHLSLASFERLVTKFQGRLLNGPRKQVG